MSIINDKLLGIICGDVWLAGTDLEGEDPKRPATILLNFIKELATRYPIKPLPPKIVELQVIIDALNKSTDPANEISEKLVDSATGSQLSILMFGGFKHHAMLYEFKKNFDGSLYFIVHNSGAGISYHHQTFKAIGHARIRQKFCSTLIYKLCPEKCTKEALMNFVQSLEIAKKEAQDEKQLYIQVLPQCSFLGGELVNPSELLSFGIKPVYISGQYSGTCTSKVLNTMLISAFSDESEAKDRYTGFMLEYKQYVVNKYIEQNTQPGRKITARGFAQVRLALEHIAGTIAKYTEEKRRIALFGIGVDAAAATEKYNLYIAWLKEQQDIYSIDGISKIETSRKADIFTVSEKKIDITILPTTEISTLEEFKLISSKPLDLPSIGDGESVKSKLEKILQWCKEKQDEKKYLDISYALPKIIQEIYGLELLVHDIARHEDKMQVLDVLKQLNEIYCKAISTYYPSGSSDLRITPDQVLMSLVMGSYAVKFLYKVSDSATSEDRKELLTQIKILNTSLKQSVKLMKRNPWMRLIYPYWTDLFIAKIYQDIDVFPADESLTHDYNGYKSLRYSWATIAEYYDRILRSDSKLYEFLLEKFTKEFTEESDDKNRNILEAIKSSDLQVFYILVTSFNKIKEDSQIKDNETIKKFMQLLQIEVFFSDLLLPASLLGKELKKEELYTKSEMIVYDGRSLEPELALMIVLVRHALGDIKYISFFTPSTMLKANAWHYILNDKSTDYGVTDERITYPIINFEEFSDDSPHGLDNFCQVEFIKKLPFFSKGEASICEQSLLKMLLLLRSQPGLQFSLTLEFFARDFKLLSDKNLRSYCLLNLLGFQDLSVENVEKLNQFVIQGITYFSTKSWAVYENSVLINMEVTVYERMISSVPDSRSDIKHSILSKLEERIKLLDGWLPIATDPVCCDMHAVRIKLLDLKLNLLKTADQIKKESNKDDYRKLLESFLYTQHHSGTGTDTEYQENFYALNRILHHRASLMELMGDFIRGKDIPVILEKVFPLINQGDGAWEVGEDGTAKYQVKETAGEGIADDSSVKMTYAINLFTAQCLSFSDRVGGQLMPLPQYFYPKPSYTKLFGSSKKQCIKIKQGVYQLEHDGLSYRIIEIADKPEDLIFQVELAINGSTTKAWFEFQKIDQRLPEYLMDPQFFIAVSLDEPKKIMFLDGVSRNPYYEYTSSDGRIREVNPGKKSKAIYNVETLASFIPKEDCTYSDQIKNLIKAISRFEAPEFCLILHSTENLECPYKVKFIRYNLELLSKIRDDKLIFVLATDERYVLDLTLASDRRDDCKDFMHSLMLVNDTVSPSQQVLLFPLQPFVPVDKEAQIAGSVLYTPFTPDLSRRHKKDFRTEAQKQIRKKDSPPLSEFSIHSTQEVLTVAMEAGKLKDVDIEQLLYMSCLLLAEQKPLKAYELLNECIRKGGLTGTYLELQCINWLVTQILPKVNTPEYLALRLKALYLYSLIDNPKIVDAALDAMPIISTKTEMDRNYQIRQKSLLESFTKGVYLKYLEAILESYLKKQGNLYYIVQLSAGEIFQLLRLLKKNSKLKTELDYVYKQLKEFHGKVKPSSSMASISSVKKLDIDPIEYMHIAERELMFSYADFIKVIQDQFQYKTDGYGCHQQGNLDEWLKSSLERKAPLKLNAKTTAKDLLEQYYTCVEIIAKGKSELTELNLFCDAVLLTCCYSKNGGKVINVDVLKLLCLSLKVLHKDVKLECQDARLFFQQLDGKHIKCNMHVLGKVSETKTYVEIKDAHDDEHKLLPHVASDVEYEETEAEEIDLTSLFSDAIATIAIEGELRSIESAVISDIFIEKKQSKAKVDVQIDSYKTEHQGRYLASCASLFSCNRADTINKISRLTLEVEQKINTTETAITQLLKKGIRSEHREIRELQLRSGVKTSVSTEEIASFYLKKDTIGFCSVAGVSQEIAIDVFYQYHQLLITKTLHQRLCMAKKLLEDDSISSSPIKQSEFLALISRKKISEPVVLVFEVFKGIVLRDTQLKAIEELLSKDKDTYKNIAIQLIMGDGKSKVLLPIMARKKADGTRLPIILVPEALYHTNLIDLNETSMRVFNQRAIGLVFDRSSESSSGALKEILQKLSTAIIYQNYVVSTAESILSLRLKYFELLEYAKNKDESLQENKELFRQIKWLNRILLLLKNQADALLDEIDSGLDIHHELHYTQCSDYLQEAEIKYSIDFFRFILSISDMPTFSIDAVVLTVEHINVIADALLNDEKSPLDGYIKTFTEEQDRKKKSLKLFLTDLSAKIPDFVTTQDVRDQLAFYRRQLTGELKNTLASKLHQEYGPSKCPKKLPIEQCIAIPYLGSDCPKEQERFNPETKTINYSIQLLLVLGFSKAQLRYIVDALFNEAKKEVQTSAGAISIEQTQAYRSFKSLTDESLSSIDTSNDEAVSRLTTKLKDNKEFIFYVLEKFVLPRVKLDTRVLFGQSHHLTSMFHSFQGFTGTPWNTEVYQEIPFCPNLSLGVDGKTRNLLCRKETKIIQRSSEDSFTKVIEDYYARLGKDKNRFRALIDVAGFSRGLGRLAFAKELAKICVKNNSEIKFILYFSEDDILCAYPVSSEGRDVKEIIISSSNPEHIQSILDVCPEQRFTIYDERHTVGADILQAKDTIGLVTADQYTLEKDILQGSMRLRQLTAEQEVAIVTANLEAKDIESLLKMTREQQFKTLEEDYYISTLWQMDAVFANFFLQLIEDSPIEHKAEIYSLINSCFQCFVRVDTLSLFDKYGSVITTKQVSEILEDKKNQLLEQYDALIKKVEVAECSCREGLLSALKKQRSTLSRQVDVVTEKCKQDIGQTEKIFPVATEAKVQVQVDVQIQLQVQIDATVKASPDDKIAAYKEVPFWLKLKDDKLKWSDADSLLGIISQVDQEKLFSLQHDLTCCSDRGKVEAMYTRLYRQHNISGLHSVINNFFGIHGDYDDQLFKPTNKEITLKTIKERLITMGKQALQDFLKKPPTLTLAALIREHNSATTQSHPESLFDDNILVLQEFALTYVSQKDPLDNYSKPWLCQLMLKTSDKKITSIAIPLYIAELLIQYLNKKDSIDATIAVNSYIWVQTTGVGVWSTVLAGKTPDGVAEDESYLRLQEQIHFMAADWQYFINRLANKQKPHWLFENFAEKIKFMREVILPIRHGVGQRAAFDNFLAIVSDGKFSGFNPGVPSASFASLTCGEPVRSGVERVVGFMSASSIHTPSSSPSELYGLTSKTTTGDGNCLFHAIAHSCPGVDHAALRIHACNHLEYAEDHVMRQDRYWGTDLEIQALVAVLRRPIVVLLNTGEPMVYMTAQAEEKGEIYSTDPIFIHSNATSRGFSGTHYSAMTVPDGQDVTIFRQIIDKRDDRLSDQFFPFNLLSLNSHDLCL